MARMRELPIQPGNDVDSTFGWPGAGSESGSLKPEMGTASRLIALINLAVNYYEEGFVELCAINCLSER